MIPATLLASAKSLSNFQSLLRLVPLITPRTYTLNVLRVFLHHVRIELISLPPHVEVTQARVLQGLRVRYACFSSTQGLCAVINACKAGANAKATADEILLHLDAILAWYKCIIESPVQFSDDVHFDLKDPYRICATLHLLAGLDPRLERALFSSYSAIEVVVAAWNIRNREAKPYVTFEGFTDGCLIVQLLANIAYFNGSRQKLFDLLCDQTPSCQALRTQVVENAISRLEVIKSLDRNTILSQLRVKRPFYSGSPVQAVMLYLSKILAGVLDMCHHPIMQEMFLRSSFPKSMCEALKTWVVDKAHKVKDHEFRVMGFVISVTLLSLVERRGTTGRQSAHALHGMIDGGMMRGLAIHFERFHRLGALATSLTMELINLLGLDYGRADFLQGTGSGSKWGGMCRDITFATDTALRNSAAKVELCDNFNCTASNKSFSPSKTCSGCHAVVYCSLSCQKEDWEVQHRRECRPARRDHKDAALDKTQYRQALRYFHTLFALRRANCSAFQAWEASLDLNITLAPKILVLGAWEVSSYTYMQYPYQRLSLPNPSESYSGSRHQQHYFNGRVMALFLEYAKEGVHKGIRLLETIHGFGDKEVFTMVKLQPQAKSSNSIPGEDTFELISAVTRVIPSRNSSWRTSQNDELEPRTKY